jgi:hypothetical protein
MLIVVEDTLITINGTLTSLKSSVAEYGIEPNLIKELSHLGCTFKLGDCSTCALNRHMCCLAMEGWSCGYFLGGELVIAEHKFPDNNHKVYSQLKELMGSMVRVITAHS